MAQLGKRKRTGAASVSRHKKKYWRKGTDAADAEKTAEHMRHEKAAGGLITDRADADLFQIDRTPTARLAAGKKTYTKKQKAALEKISLLAARDVDGPIKLPTPKAPKEKLKYGGVKVEVIKAASKKKDPTSFDLWNTELDIKLDVPEFAEHGADFYLKQTKKVVPKIPKSLRIKPSLLKAVEVPDAGASYNPEITEYKEYVTEIYHDEVKFIANEERTERLRKLAPGETYVTEADRKREMHEGLEEPKDEDEEEAGEGVEMKGVGEDGEEAGVSHLKSGIEIKLKKRKDKNRAKAHKIRERKAAEAKAKHLLEHSVFRSKSLMKQLTEEEKVNNAKKEVRDKKKALEDVSKRKKLGRGTYEEPMEPFLLEEELVGNLRQLKPQGSLAEDRFKSLQRRNILPIAGEKNHRRLPTRLRVKEKERRAHREVTADYKPI